MRQINDAHVAVPGLAVVEVAATDHGMVRPEAVALREAFDLAATGRGRVGRR
ncbi:DUF6207 family protein [Streptomyces sp. NPDC005004]